MSAMTAPVNVIAVLHQYENFNGLFKKKLNSVSALTQIHEHQIKALLLKD